MKQITIFKAWNAGFTLVEALLAMGIGMLLLLIAGSIVSDIIPQNSLTYYSQTLLSDFRYQQLKSMTNQTEGQSTAQQFGIHIEAQSYTLFRGSSYVTGAPSNLVVTVDSPSSLSTTFAGGDIIFDAGSGEIDGFTGAFQTVTISNSVTGETDVLTFNKYGVVL